MNKDNQDKRMKIIKKFNFASFVMYEKNIFFSLFIYFFTNFHHITSSLYLESYKSISSSLLTNVSILGNSFKLSILK